MDKRHRILEAMYSSLSFEASRPHSAEGDRSGFGPLRRGRAILWLLCAAAVGLCFYRLATFTPQPLDSSNTLRPFLNRWFVAFVKLYSQPEEGLAAWKSLCLVLLLIPPVLALLNFVREHRSVSLPGHAMRFLCLRSLLFVSIAIALITCRYSSFLTYQLNVDEAQFLSAAQKLFWDGNFFRSVDTGTSGPLNIYPLMLPALFGLSPDFASSRVLALIFVFCDVYLLYQTVRLLAPDSVARIAIVPIVTAFATFRDPNLLHYSSEQTPLLVISAALYTSVSVLANPPRHRMRLLFLGFLTSAGFFSKMQSVPVIVVMGAVAIAYTHASGHAPRFWRPVALYAAGALPLLMLNALLCWAGGVGRDFWMSYIISNLRYADVQSHFLPDLLTFMQILVTLTEVRFLLISLVALGIAFAIQGARPDQNNPQNALLQLFVVSGIVIAAVGWLQSSEGSLIRGYLALFALLAVPLYCLYCLLSYHPKHFGTDPVRWFGLLSAFSFAAALYCVYKPHRPFYHYLLFLYFPGFSAMAWMLIRRVGTEAPEPNSFRGLRPVAFPFVVLFVLLAVTNSVYLWGSEPDPMSETLVATVSPPEGDFIRSLASPNGRITVWGWTADPYLGSGHMPATRDLNIGYLFYGPSGMAPYYHARFVHDLNQNPPELFVDAVGPTSWYFRDRTSFGFEQFPEIARFIAVRYIYLLDAYGQRYYLRRDLAAKGSQIARPKNCAHEAVTCVDTPLRNPHGPGAALVDVAMSLPKLQMPAHALIEVLFTPAAVQTADATVFNNEAVPYSHLGFRFHSIGGDRYQLVLGLGTEFAFSKPIPIPPGKQAFISIEMNERDVYIRANGTAVETMRLKARMADAPGLVTLGSYVDGHCRFWGTIQFFQILDLGKKPG